MTYAFSPIIEGFAAFGAHMPNFGSMSGWWCNFIKCWRKYLITASVDGFDLFFGKGDNPVSHDVTLVGSCNDGFPSPGRVKDELTYAVDVGGISDRIGLVSKPYKGRF